MRLSNVRRKLKRTKSRVKLNKILLGLSELKDISKEQCRGLYQSYQYFYSKESVRRNYESIKAIIEADSFLTALNLNNRDIKAETCSEGNKIRGQANAIAMQ